jgi:hypothetical protein
MKRIIIISAILIFVNVASGQNFRITYNFGYNSYQLFYLKELQTSMATSSIFQAKVLENFPNHIHNSFQLEYNLNAYHAFGLSGSFISTGGRNHVADYSGEYRLDFILNGIDMAAHYRFTQEITPRLKTYERVAVGVTFSSLKIEEELNIGEITLSENYSFRSNPFGGIFSVGAMVLVTSNIWLNLNVGYQRQFNQRFYLKENKHAYLINTDSGGKVYCNWSGLRTGIGVSFAF